MLIRQTEQRRKRRNPTDIVGVYDAFGPGVTDASAPRNGHTQQRRCRSRPSPARVRSVATLFTLTDRRTIRSANWMIASLIAKADSLSIHRNLITFCILGFHPSFFDRIDVSCPAPSSSSRAPRMTRSSGPGPNTHPAAWPRAGFHPADDHSADGTVFNRHLVADADVGVPADTPAESLARSPASVR